MKPKLEHLPLGKDESFVVKFFDYKFYPTPWHYHPEYELVLVTESTGKRFIGDTITSFKPGDLALIGSDLPHLYKNDPEYYHPQSTLRAKSIVVHFSEASFGPGFFSLPESKGIKNLLSWADHGLEIKSRTNEEVSVLMHELVEMNGLPRWLKWLQILSCLASATDLSYISKRGIQGKNKLEHERLTCIFNFVAENYKREIKLKEVADMVNMAENSFSRFFSQQTRKSFSTFLNEFRLGHASKMLIESEKSVITICYESGFKNVSNFNRMFKNVYGISPLQYRKQFWQSGYGKSI
jgi:AraC-like DNA-binding protein